MSTPQRRATERAILQRQIRALDDEDAAASAEGEEEEVETEGEEEEATAEGEEEEVETEGGEEEEATAEEDDDAATEEDDEETEDRVALFQGLPEAKGHQKMAAKLARTGMKTKAARAILTDAANAVKLAARVDRGVSARTGNAAGASNDVAELTALATSAGFAPRRRA